MDEEKYSNLLAIYKLIWYAKFDEADDVLQSIYRKKHPAFDLLLCENLMIKSVISEDKNDFKTAIKYIKESIENANLFLLRQRPSLKRFMKKSDEKEKEKEKEKKEIVIDDDYSTSLSNALWALAISAELHLMISIIRFRQQKYVKGVFHWRKSWRIYEEGDDVAKKMESDQMKIMNFNEVKAMIDMGVGLFNFACSAMPLHFQFIIENIGFKADRELAMNKITQSSNTPSSFRSSTATVGLAWIYSFFYYDYEKAMELAHIALSRSPSNGFCMYTMGNIMRKEGLLHDAISKFNDILHVMPYAMGFQIKLKYEMGHTYYLMGDWHNALPLLEFYVTHSISPSYKAIAMFQTAFCYHMMGDDEKMADFIKKITPHVRKNFPYDEYAKRMAKKYFAKKLDEFELQFHYCFLLLECSKFSQILELCDKLQQIEVTLIDQLRIFTLRGTCLLYLKDLKGSKEYFQLVVANETKVKKERFVLPHSFVGLAEIALSEGHIELAQSLIKKAKGYSNYDLESNFVWKIRRTEDLIYQAKQNN